MRANIDSMKSFVEIVNIEDIHKYVDVMKRTLAAERREIENETIEDMNRLWEPFSDKLTKDIKDLYKDILDSKEENLKLAKENMLQKTAIDILAEKAEVDKNIVYEKMKSGYSIFSIKDL